MKVAVEAASEDKLKKQVGKMQCRKVSYLLAQNGDNHTWVHHLAGCSLGPRRFHLQDQGFLLARQVFAGFLLIYCPGLGFFKEATGVDCPVSPLFQPINSSPCLALHTDQQTSVYAHVS